MSRHFLALIAVGSFLVGSTVSADESSEAKNAALLAAVKKLDVAFEKQDTATIRTLVDVNHISIAPSYQFFNRKDQLKTLPELKITLFETAPKTILHLTPRTALISYKAKLAGTYAGKPLPARVQILESWVKRKGKWVETSYQETQIP